MNIMRTGVPDAKTPPVIFWGEIAPCEDLAQIYTNPADFLDILVDFIGNGLRADEGVIVIATRAHLVALRQQLPLRGFNLAGTHKRQQYIALDAREALAKFMVRGWPDEQRFGQFVSTILAQARCEGQRVRVFSEMAAVSWALGQMGAVRRLGQLWQQRCQAAENSLLCVYPPNDFTQSAETSLQEICAIHARATVP